MRTSHDGTEEPEIVAAGGVVVREEERSARLAVIHRPKYDDWSLPKGKLEPGESWKQAAVREVREETGMRCKPRGELSPVSYRDRKGRAKKVRYWLMEPLEGLDEFEPGDEVDELRWVDRRGARKLLSYDHDRELIREALGGGWWDTVRNRLRGNREDGASGDRD